MNRVGVSQIEDIGRRLVSEAVPPVRMVSSVIPRARQTAEILSEWLQAVDVVYSEVLSTGCDAPVKAYSHGDMESIHSLVKAASDGVETLIVVTHLEVGRDYPAHFLQQELGLAYLDRPLGRGEAVAIDCRSGETRRL